MSPEEKKRAAQEVGISVQAMRKRIKKHGDEQAASMPRQSKSQAGKAGKRASPWRHDLNLKGSRV